MVQATATGDYGDAAMKEATLHLDDAGHAQDIHFDGAEGTPISAFILLTSVPADPPAGHIIAYGNSDIIGRLLFNFWRNSVNKNPEGAWIVEEVARDIIKAADAERKQWPTDERAGRA